MSNSTASLPGGVVLAWRHAPVGSPAECVFGDGITICRYTPRPRRGGAR